MTGSGWRYMFVLGVLPAVLVFFIRRGVDESPAWKETHDAAREGMLSVLRSAIGSSRSTGSC
jgi:MFS family permease